MVDFATIDLDICHREPIDVPGRIQPHGLLIALELGPRHHAQQANEAIDVDWLAHMVVKRAIATDRRQPADIVRQAINRGGVRK